MGSIVFAYTYSQTCKCMKKGFMKENITDMTSSLSSRYNTSNPSNNVSPSIVTNAPLFLTTRRSLSNTTPGAANDGIIFGNTNNGNTYGNVFLNANGISDNANTISKYGNLLLKYQIGNTFNGNLFTGNLDTGNLNIGNLDIGNLNIGNTFGNGDLVNNKTNGLIGGWTPPGWTALWNGGNAVGGVGVDQIFHISWQEGDFGQNGINYDEPSMKDTDNRFGGGFNWGALPEPTVTAPEDDSYQQINGDLTFYAPGTFMYGPDTYVPSYVDSVLLSPMLGVNAPVHQDWSKTRKGTSWTDAVDENGKTYNRYQKWLKNKSDTDDVCKDVDMGYKSTLEREKYCQNLDTKSCGTKKCCVSLGGSFCLAGNEQGPLNQTAYTNPMYTKTDFYIHNGKCYGNCPPYLSLDLGAETPPLTGTFQEEQLRFGDKSWSGPLNIQEEAE